MPHQHLSVLFGGGGHFSVPVSTELRTSFFSDGRTAYSNQTKSHVGKLLLLFTVSILAVHLKGWFPTVAPQFGARPVPPGHINA